MECVEEGEPVRGVQQESSKGADWWEGVGGAQVGGQALSPASCCAPATLNVHVGIPYQRWRIWTPHDLHAERNHVVFPQHPPTSPPPV